MTKQEILNAIEEANAKLQEVAQERYTQKMGAELRANCRRLAVETSMRYALIMNGEAPRAFGAYDRDEIARILNTNIVLVYGGYSPRVLPDMENMEKWEEAAEEANWSVDAEEKWDRGAFIEAYEKYLHTAAAFAKSIGSTHAMRLYLLAWGLVRKTGTQCNRFMLAADEALRTVNLERVATDRLWVDVEAMKLPAFKPRKAAKPRRRSAKKRKVRG